MKIKHALLPKQKTRKHNLKVEIDLYFYATELYEELDKIGIINRIKEIPQLGVIKVNKKLAKTRFDYVMLQVYLHKMIKANLQGKLRFSYNNYINSEEFGHDYQYPDKKSKKPSIGDILQILTIIYNIGHFYNTFTASRSITMLSSEDKAFYNLVVNASTDERYQNVAKAILQRKNYQRLHLLNSLLILEHCDTSKQSISVAIEILYAYINEQLLNEENKLKYIFDIFKKIRTISYMAYDLQIAETPLTIDLCNEKAILLLLEELLSEYNNNQSSNFLLHSITKLLDDTVYNENSNAICYYRISRKMVSLLTKEPNYSRLDYYKDLFDDKKSLLNRIHAHKRDYHQSQILKLTFSAESRKQSEQLLLDLDKINNTRVGYYDRHSGEQTILVSIKKNCNSAAKRVAAYKTMKCAVNYIRRIIPNPLPIDKRYLLSVKFFFFYLFDENPVVIKPTISRDVCVICTRGKNTRVKEIQSRLKDSIGNEDENHEIEFLLSNIKDDTVNDTSITIPASIIVYKNSDGSKLSEFDGMIIHPMRKNNQIIFLEAKNRDKQPSFGKNCLKDKFNKFSFDYLEEDIHVVDCDAYLKFTI